MFFAFFLFQLVELNIKAHLNALQPCDESGSVLRARRAHRAVQTCTVFHFLSHGSSKIYSTIHIVFKEKYPKFPNI